MGNEPVRDPQAANSNVVNALFGEEFQDRAAETAGGGVVFHSNDVGNLYQQLAEKIFVERFHEPCIDNGSVDSQGCQVFRCSESWQNGMADAKDSDVLSRSEKLAAADLKVSQLVIHRYSP